MIGWEDYTLVISFVSKGFPYKDHTEESFIVMIYCMYSQHVKLSTLSLISLFLTAAYLSKALYSLIVLKVPLNNNQSIILALAYLSMAKWLSEKEDSM